VLDHQVGDNKLAAVLLGECFEAAGSVHGVANGSQVMRITVANLAHDYGARVNADPYAQWVLQLARQFAAKFGDTADHRVGGEERLPTGSLKVGVDSEQCHHAIACVLICNATSLSDGSADRFEVAVEQKDDVVGQLVLGDPCESAYVSE
jgi:hypothetical protein